LFMQKVVIFTLLQTAKRFGKMIMRLKKLPN
jgi:hypothetical protein